MFPFQLFQYLTSLSTAIFLSIKSSSKQWSPGSDSGANSLISKMFLLDSFISFLLGIEYTSLVTWHSNQEFTLQCHGGLSNTQWNELIQMMEKFREKIRIVKREGKSSTDDFPSLFTIRIFSLNFFFWRRLFLVTFSNFPPQYSYIKSVRFGKSTG